MIIIIVSFTCSSMSSREIQPQRYYQDLFSLSRLYCAVLLYYKRSRDDKSCGDHTFFNEKFLFLIYNFCWCKESIWPVQLAKRLENRDWLDLRLNLVQRNAFRPNIGLYTSNGIPPRFTLSLTAVCTQTAMISLKNLHKKIKISSIGLPLL